MVGRAATMRVSSVISPVERHVEIDAHEHALSVHVNVFDGFSSHGIDSIQVKFGWKMKKAART
jgi:hypothetical protein